MENLKIKLELTVAQINLVLIAIGKAPLGAYGNVTLDDVLSAAGAIKEQGDAQLAAAQTAEAAAAAPAAAAPAAAAPAAVDPTPNPAPEVAAGN